MDKSGFYKSNVIYQIYVRSFYDSNGDGIGDLRGIILKLDYLQKLGVKILWLSPIFPSKNVDYGYDVKDYMSINPEYGTMDDFTELLEEARKRGMRILLDMVLNHTSSACPWFINSKDPNSKYFNYYIWREGRKNNTLPPNNWKSMFMGPAWTYCKENKLWYLHLYTADQPDLNWKNESVYDEFKKIMSFWLSKGIYGFRMDSINSLYKTSLDDGKRSFSLTGKELYMNQEGGHYILHRFYKDVFSKFECITIGETSNVDFKEAKKYTSEELDMILSFAHISNNFRKFPTIKRKRVKPEEWKRIIESWQDNFDHEAFYLENHDQLRSIGKYGNTSTYYKESAKMLSCLLLFLRSTPIIYQGEEIGMVDYPSFKLSRCKDIVPLAMKDLFKRMHLPFFYAKDMVFSYDRDNSRCPLQWNSSPNAGFSSGTPWLEVNGSYKTININDNLHDPDSILAFYKKAIRFKCNSNPINYGDIAFCHLGKGILAFTRSYMGEKIEVILNLNGKTRKIKDPLCVKAVFSNYDKHDFVYLDKLLPYEALVIDISDIK